MSELQAERSTQSGASHGPAPAPSSTPTLRSAFRRGRFWVLAAAGALAVAIAAALIAGAGSADRPVLAADSPTPTGGMALAEVLRKQGVRVLVADTLDEAREAAARASDPTLFFFDENGRLTPGRLRDMAALAPRTVIAAPDFSALRALAPGVGFAGASSAASLGARCDVAAAERAGSLSPKGNTLRLPKDAGPDYTGCFPSGDRTFSVVERRSPGGTLTFVAPAEVFSNDAIARYGNAALALNLLGASDTLVWYLPTLADVQRTGPPSLGELSPAWLTPVLILLVFVVVAAAVWRGRRFGPLVAENLPVVVRASETMEGRARLYARASARLRALDALRVGTLQRLARSAGLARTASVEEVVLAVAELTGSPPAAVRELLVGSVPTSDRDLVALSRGLEDLERQAAIALDPSSPSRSHERMDP